MKTEAGERQVALDGAMAKLAELREAEAALKAAELRRDRLKREAREALRATGAAVGTIAGRPVVRETVTKTFRGKDFATDRPDLVEKYTKAVLVDRLDTEALARELPDIYAKYLARALTFDWKTFDALAGGQDAE